MTFRDFAQNGKTIVEVLRNRANHQSEQVAYTFLLDGEAEARHFTYRQLDQRARAIASNLQSRCHPGDRVLLIYPPGLDYNAALFACFYAGVIAIPVHPPKPNRSLTRLQHINANAQPQVALTNQTTLALPKPSLLQDPELKNLQWIATDSILDTQAEQWRELDLTEDTIALLQYTSGSTGKPKGVAIAHRHLMSNLALIYYHFGHSANSRGVIWLPPYHDMGLIGGLLQPIYGGFPVVLMSPVAFLQKPIRWLKAISRYGATTSGGPNFAYDLCVRTIKTDELERLDLSTWDLAFNGAEPIRSTTLEQFTETFSPYGFRRSAFYPCYGMAETTLLITGGVKTQEPMVHWVESVSQHSQSSKRAIVGCGHSCSNHQVIIVNPESLTRCQEGQEGEIWIAGSSVAQGYWNQPQATNQTFHARLPETGEQFLRSGDLGFLLADELFVTGRLKDRILIRGQNYYPQDLELSVEQSHPGIKPHCSAAFLVELADEDRLVIVTEVERHYCTASQTTKNEIVQAIRSTISAQYELQVYAVALLKPGSLPKTPSGKIQRHVCREQFLYHQLQTIETQQLNYSRDSLDNVSEINDLNNKQKFDPMNLSDVIEDWLKHWLIQKLGVPLETFDRHASFTDYGIDSLMTVQLIQDLQEWLHISCNEHILEHFPTIDALVQHLVKNIADKHIADDGKNNDQAQEFYWNTPAQLLQRSEQQQDVPLEYYQFEYFPEYQNLKQQRSQIQALGLNNPFFRPQEQIVNHTTVIDRDCLINYATYNYLGMSGDPTVSEAAQAAIARYGTSVSASRLLSGERPLHRELEREIAHFIGTEDSLVFVGGHATNVSTISHLVGRNDLILYDALSHNSIMQGALLSGATLLSFPHNNWQALAQKLANIRHQYQRVLIVIEGVYSTDGDIPNLPQFIAIKHYYKAILMIDEAHSIGVLGRTGRGISEHFGIPAADVDIWMGTLSKSLASCGGYIAGCAALIDYLKYTAPGFIYSVGISPPNAAAALAALHLLQAEPQRITCLQERSQLFLSLAQSRGINTGNSQGSPIIPIIVDEELKAVQLAQNLFDRGINVQFMIYPTVPQNAARLRFFVSCLHTEEQIRRTVEVLAEELNKLAAVVEIR